MLRRRWWWGGLFAALVLGAMASCSDDDDNGVTKTPDGGTTAEAGVDGAKVDATTDSALPDAALPDGAPNDAGTDAPPGDAGVDARVFFDGFEIGTDCPGWIGLYGSTTREDGGKSGQSSCRFCLTSATTGAAFQDVAGGPKGTYQLEAFTRQVTGTNSKAWVNLILIPDGGAQVDQSSAMLVQNAQYQSSSIQATTLNDVATARLRVLLEGAIGDCIVVDDVALSRQP